MSKKNSSAKRSWLGPVIIGRSNGLADDIEAKRAAKIDVEEIVSPVKQIVRGFMERKLAVGALCVVIAMFLLVFIGPLFMTTYTDTYTEVTQANLPPTMSMLSVPSEQKIYNKQLDVRVDLPDKPVWTRAERDSITQVIYNLIENAIKFCPDGGRLSLRVRSDGGKARVSVENTGPTIDKDELPLLFDRFHKADYSRSMDREGVGLGLYIVKTILGNLKENITVTSEDGGTNFTFTLTLA